MNVFKVTSYPIYIIDVLNGGVEIVFPEGKEDINHVDFWSETVARSTVKLCGVKQRNVESLKNAPYCMRRARITSKGIVYYGEEQTDELLEKIREAVGEPDLKWGFDEHETRTEYDQSIFKIAKGS